MRQRSIDVQVCYDHVDMVIRQDDLLHEDSVGSKYDLRPVEYKLKFEHREISSLADKFNEAKWVISGGLESVDTQAHLLEPGDFIESLGVYVLCVVPYPERLALARIEVSDVRFKVKGWELNLAFHLPITVLRKIS